MGRACQSLIEAHEAGIIHRDIKPQNLFVTHVGDEYDFIKLLDFGIARVTQADENAQSTRASVVSGTPGYIAPELLCGQQADARSDIYGLGATLYALLTGRPPFEGEAPGKVIAAQLSDSVQRPSARRGEPIPLELERFVLRCLARDPNERFHSVRELADALAPLMVDEPWSAQDAERFWRNHVERLGFVLAPTQTQIVA